MTAPIAPTAQSDSGGQPPGLWVLFITEMWERFSYYGMRALLVLYLTSSAAETLRDGTANNNPGFGWAKDDASVLYGIYTAAVYLTPIAGGLLADRFLGTHRSMLIGGWIIAAGHLTLAATELFGVTPGKVVTMETAPGALACFLTGLVLIVVGTGFFKPCVSVMVGQLYERGDPRRDSGFTIFYMGINLGAFFSPLVAGTLGETIGWHWGFGSAAVGMLAGLYFYQKFRPAYLGDIGLPPAHDHSSEERQTVSAVDEADDAEPSVGIVLQRLAVIVILALLGNIAFWTAFEQAGSSMNLFARDETDRTLGGLWPGEGFPATSYQSVNPLAILLFAPVFSWLWIWLDQRGWNPSTPMKFAWGLYLLGIAFLAMVAGAFEARGSGLAGPHWLLITYVVVTWGELCLSPVGLSMVTKLSPKRLQSLMMGVWFASFSLANLCAGLLAAFSTKMDTSRHLVPLDTDRCYADVRLDSRSRELRVILVEPDSQTPLPIREEAITFQIAYRIGSDSEQHAELVLGAEPQSGDPEGTSSQFTSAGTQLPPEIDDIEDVRGRLIVSRDGEQLEGELVHEHYTFVFEGLAGFYLLLVVVPLAAGLLITLLTPVLKRMMHGIH